MGNVPVLGKQFLVSFTKLHPRVGIGRDEVHLILGDLKRPVFSLLLRNSLDDDRLNAQASEHVSKAGSRVRFLDCPCQWRLTPDGNTGRGGGRCPACQASRDDELILRAEWVTRWWNLGSNDT